MYSNTSRPSQQYIQGRADALEHLGLDKEAGLGNAAIKAGGYLKRGLGHLLHPFANKTGDKLLRSGTSTIEKARRRGVTSDISNKMATKNMSRKDAYKSVMKDPTARLSAKTPRGKRKKTKSKSKNYPNNITRDQADRLNLVNVEKGVHMNPRAKVMDNMSSQNINRAQADKLNLSKIDDGVHMNPRAVKSPNTPNPQIMQGPMPPTAQQQAWGWLKQNPILAGGIGLGGYKVLNSPMMGGGQPIVVTNS